MVRRQTSALGRTLSDEPGGRTAGGRGLFGRLLGAMHGADLRVRSRGATRREAASIAFASGKGGTGKSFLAVNLAVELQRRRAEDRVTLVDCDFGLACDHLLLGVTPRTTLQHVLAGRASIDEVRVATPAGPTLVPGGTGLLHMANLADRDLAKLASVLGDVSGTDDLVLLDVGAGIAPQNIMTQLAADHVVLVTNPEITALTDAYAIVKVTAQLRADTKFLVVVNRCTAPGQGEQASARLAEVARRHADIRVEFLGEVLEDPQVMQRRVTAEPAVLADPDSATATSIRAIADALELHAGPLEARELTVDTGIEARFLEHRLVF